MSLIVVEDGTPGYNKVRKLDKVGALAQDTAELFFEDCRVPKENLLGPEEGQGFVQLMQKLQQERLSIAVSAMANMWAVLHMTKQYCQERIAFRNPIIKFQNTRFKLVEMYTTAEICQTFCDRLLKEHLKGTDVVTETSMAKYFFNEECKKIVDQCLQFFGGYGYMDEYGSIHLGAVLTAPVLESDPTLPPDCFINEFCIRNIDLCNISCSGLHALCLDGNFTNWGDRWIHGWSGEGTGTREEAEDEPGYVKGSLEHRQLLA